MSPKKNDRLLEANGEFGVLGGKFIQNSVHKNFCVKVIQIFWLRILLGVILGVG